MLFYFELVSNPGSSSSSWKLRIEAARTCSKLEEYGKYHLPCPTILAKWIEETLIDFMHTMKGNKYWHMILSKSDKLINCTVINKHTYVGRL